MIQMKAIIKIDVPGYQIGQEVSIYFKDTMNVKGICEAERTGHWIKAKPWMLDYTSYKWECSECEKSERFRHNYCPSCGCRMVEPQESEVRNDERRFYI